MTKDNILHQKNGSIRPNFGDGDSGRLIVVWAGIAIQRILFVDTVLGAGPDGAIQECRFTAVVWFMSAIAAGANFGIVHGLDDLRGAELLDSTSPGEREMVSVKPLDSAEETGSAVPFLIVPGLKKGVLILFLGEFGTNRFHSHIHGWQSDIEKRGICFVAVVKIFHALIEKLEHSRTAYVIVSIQVNERSMFVIEGDAELNGEASDDVGAEIRG